MTRRILVLAALAVLAACATQPPATVSLPPNVRPDIDHKWITADGGILWPPADGFAAPPTPVVLPAGTLIDRFGTDGGTFFSPKGASFAARALPYVCDRLTYKVYITDKPLLVWTGKALAWFDQPGGATQFQTDETAAGLQSDGIIEPVNPPGAAPCPH